MKSKPALLMILVSVFVGGLPGASALAQTYPLEIAITPEQVGTMPLYEAVIGGDIDALDVYRFVRECEAGAAGGPDHSGSLTRFSLDDVLECRALDSSGAVEVEISMITALTAKQTRGSVGGGTETLAVRFSAESAARYRVLLGRGGEWSAWSSEPILREVSVPDEGEEEQIHFEVESWDSETESAVQMSGYLKVKKLNSGD